MKKIISIALTLCLVVGVMCALTSCFGGGIPSGTYSIEGFKEVDLAECKVSGSKIIYTVESDETKIDITFNYEVKEDKITVTYEGNNYEGDSYIIKGLLITAEAGLKLAFAGEKSFEKGDGYFKIGEVKFVKE